jgi:uncharacterized damage-inducible protein DinB
MAPSTEHRDLLAALAERRQFLRGTVRGLSDEQAAERTTVSELCLGGLIKHVASVEAAWCAFIVGGADGMDATTSEQDYEANFRMLPGETLDAILAHYDEVARATDELVLGLDDLSVDQPLPTAPWFEPGGRWSARRVVLHLVGETAHHSGHADILREAIDGARSMG